MNERPEIALGYQDVYLVPNKCEVRSREMADTCYSLPAFNLHLELPILPANMASVVDHMTYEHYVEMGLMPIMHRFKMDPISFCLGTTSPWRAISIGVTDADFLLVKEIAKQYKIPHCICIDIAHGFADTVGYMIDEIRKDFGERCPMIIAGNVADPLGVTFLQNCGADMIKIGIGGGSVCSTKNKTGFYVPMFTLIQQCAAVAKVPLIADGGIRENGDIAKALTAGADLVMMGSLFAACADSPAKIVDGKKEYYGSASYHNKGHDRNIEGFAVHLTPTMTIAQKVKEIKHDLQSSISYGGGTKLSHLDLQRIRYNIVK